MVTPSTFNGMKLLNIYLAVYYIFCFLKCPNNSKNNIIDKKI